MTREEPAVLQEAQERALPAARRLRLPLSGRLWRGRTGNWAGAGVGSSIDFQDHRAYLPGDDPRYINWQAYARSGHYTMKLYREEVSPQVDLALDASASMFFDPQKCRRAWEVFFFCRESALRSGASLRTYWITGDTVAEARPEALDAREFELPPAAEEPPLLAALPWRPGSLRVVVTDLLFPPRIRDFLLPLVNGNGRGILFVLHCQAERNPDWRGNLSLVDCETGRRHRQFVSRELMERYRSNYARHFEQWQAETRRHGLLAARVRSEGGLAESMQEEALRTGAVEPWA